MTAIPGVSSHVIPAMTDAVTLVLAGGVALVSPGLKYLWHAYCENEL